MNDTTSGVPAPAAAADGRPPSGLDLGQIRAVADHLPLLAWSCLPDGHCDYLSRRWVEYTGVPEADHLGRGWLDAVHPDDRDRTRVGWEGFDAGAAAYDVDYRLRRHDGAYRWFKTRGVLVRAADGTPLRVLGTTTDVDDQRRAEERDREGRERLEAALAASGTGTFRWDLVTDALDWDEQLDRLFGLPPGRTVRSLDKFVERVHPDDRSEVLERCRRCKDEGADFAMEFRVVWPDGSVRWLDDRGRTFRGGDGRPAYMTGACVDTTERRRAAEVLRESEGRLRTMVDNWPSIIFVKDPEGRYLLANQACRTYSARPPEEMIGRTDFDFLPPEYAERYRQDDLRVLRSGEPERYEEEAPVEGRPTAFLTVKFPLRDAAGRPYGVCGIATDVTDLKRAERALRETDARFRQLADAMPQIVWTAGPDGEVDYLNRRWEEFSGQPATIGNAAWGPLLHPDEAGPAGQGWAASVRTGNPFEMELRLQDRRDGGYRWHLLRTVAVRDEHGRVARWFGTATDIDAQKRAEASSRYLAQASAVLAEVVDYESTLQKVANLAVPHFADWSAVDVVNDDGTLRRLAVAHRDVDKIRLAHELMRDYPPDPDAPTGGYAVLRTGRPELVAEITDDMLTRGARDERHLGLIRSLGLRSYLCVPLAVSGTPLGVLTFVTAESGRRYAEADLVLATDLAHRAAVAVENTRLYQALRDADRRKDEFLATLAHELRNPLAPIRNALQIMKLVGGDAGAVEKSRGMMERQVGQMTRLIDDLMDLSRISRGKIVLQKTRMKLADAVQDAVDAARPLIEERGHALVVEVPPEPLSVDADRTRLAQVFANLLNNAAKYTERGGRIRVAVERQGGDVVAAVEDNGVGIPAHMLTRVFDMFTQVDRSLEKSQGGLGIGLNIVKRLVEMHGGDIVAESDGHGAGSRFVVRLPVVPTVPTDTADDRGGGRTAKPAGRRILVVDDNRDGAGSLAEMLRVMGNDTQTAFDGEEAVALAEAFKPDVILMDIGMPRLNGYEACRRIREQPWGRTVVIVAQTGWGQEDDKRKSQEAGFNFHLVKPVDPAALEKLLVGLSVTVR
jgi:PAS domain S-box-containing protein